MVGDLIAAGVVDYPTAMNLPVPVLIELDKARQRVRAQARADQADDTAAAITGNMSEAGFQLLQKHLNALRAIAEGLPPSATGHSYTENAPDVIHV